eukprot:TRINITY_DN24851_c0_g1_i1.p1 TRINITY_DN24851_c0_g1~~TRINITY_DN24851_c0_g1_i1.p1  ORF type:complete len:235 (+),score=33.50 TRINITY_DN24851_c0_g1_i1:603-1307(+)
MSTWNMVTQGRKRWALISPLAPEALARRADPPVGCHWSWGEWFAEEWPGILADARQAGWEAYEFEQGVGEMVYVPPGWWHTVLNLEPTVAVNHTVLSLPRLRSAMAGGGEVGEVAGVIDAFDLVDSQPAGGIQDWLDKIRLKFEFKNQLSCPSLWGLWGGVALPLVGQHPWLLPDPASLSLRSTTLDVLAQAGVTVRSVFGRMYDWSSHVTRVSHSHAVCIPCLLYTSPSPRDS